MDLELKNITKVLRNVRVIPPRTAYFSIGLGRFPAENGLIASGMSCQFTVRFAPDSLADFDDELIVQSNGSEFVVPLKGKRLPPELNSWYLCLNRYKMSLRNCFPQFQILLN